MLVGIVLAVAPRMLVPRLGLRRSLLIGTGWYAIGQLATAFAHTPSRLVSSILFMSVGCIGTVSLVAFISNQARKYGHYSGCGQFVTYGVRMVRGW